MGLDIESHAEHRQIYLVLQAVTVGRAAGEKAVEMGFHTGPKPVPAETKGVVLDHVERKMAVRFHYYRDHVLTMTHYRLPF